MFGALYMYISVVMVKIPNRDIRVSFVLQIVDFSTGSKFFITSTEFDENISDWWHDWRSPFCDFHIWYSHILTRTFLLFTFLLWHSLSSTYFCCTQLSFSQFSPGITQPQLSLTLHDFATHTSDLAYFCLSPVFYLKL